MRALSRAAPIGVFIGFIFGLFRMACDVVRKIGLRNSGFTKVGAQCVDMRPERDTNNQPKQNPMCILIFYIYSRVSDLWAGWLQRRMAGSLILPV